MGMLKSIQIPIKNALPCPHCFVQRRCLAEGDGNGILRRSWQRCEFLKQCDERSKQMFTLFQERNIIHAMRSQTSLFGRVVISSFGLHWCMICSLLWNGWKLSFCLVRRWMVGGWFFMVGQCTNHATYWFPEIFDKTLHWYLENCLSW